MAGTEDDEFEGKKKVDYPDLRDMEKPPKYEPPLIVEPAPVAHPTRCTRYDTMTSYAEIDSYQQGSIKFDPADVSQASYIVTNNMVGGALDEPFPVQCPYCHNIVTTKIKHVAGCMTYLACAGVGVLTSFLCCCLPFCMKRCKDVKHYCPECDNLIAIYKRL